MCLCCCFCVSESGAVDAVVVAADGTHMPNVNDVVSRPHHIARAHAEMFST